VPDPSDTEEKAGPGAQRAAALLLGLGADVAAAIFQHLDEPSVRRIAAGAKEIRKNPDAVPSALSHFVASLDKIGGDAESGDRVLRQIAEQVLGPEMAQRAFEGVAPPATDDALGPAGQADPEALAMILSREQPQTIALVLAAMDGPRAAAVMKALPEAQRPQILRRLALLEAVAPDVLREVGQGLSAELRTSVSSGMRKFDGKQAAIELLRRSPAAQQTETVQEIEKDDPELAADLRGKLFTFQDLVNLSDRDIQTLLREIDTSPSRWRSRARRRRCATRSSRTCRAARLRCCRTTSARWGRSSWPTSSWRRASWSRWRSRSPSSAASPSSTPRTRWCSESCRSRRQPRLRSRGRRASSSRSAGRSIARPSAVRATRGSSRSSSGKAMPRGRPRSR
jgi:flagellar motor switch protein FliG